MTSVKALLLNSSYEPMRVVSWQRAIILWLQDKVEIIEYHRIFARSARSSFQLPSVLRLKEYVKPRSLGAIKFCRENVYIRDNYTCQYCGQKHLPKNLTLDHVVPVSKRGPKSWTNMVAACRPCNQKKAARTPAQASMPLISEPKIPHWLPTLQMGLNPKQIPEAWRQYLRYKAG